MPIPAHLLKHYGHRWRTLTRPAILARTGGVFDSAGRYLGGARCMRCGTPDVYPVGVWLRSILECAHLNGEAADNSEENTAALCHRCHKAADYAHWILAYRAWAIAEREKRLDEKDAGRPVLATLKEVPCLTFPAPPAPPWLKPPRDASITE